MPPSPAPAPAGATRRTDSDTAAVEASNDSPKLPYTLTREEEQELREIFNLVDRDHGGTISGAELAQLMKTLQINASTGEIELMINEIDKDGNGEIDFYEFVSVMNSTVNATYSAAQVEAAFNVFAEKDKGQIQIQALRRVLLSYGSKGVRLSEEQVNELLQQLEVDERGNFDYKAYIETMLA